MKLLTFFFLFNGKKHSTLFLGSLMFVLGGRSNQVGDNLPFEIYDTESSDWYKFSSIQRFRHSVWTMDKFLYCHGGFDQDTPNVPTDTTIRIDLLDLFKNQTNLF
jgi:protein phosphatase